MPVADMGGEELERLNFPMVAAESNRKVFGNANGHSSGKWKSTATSRRPTTRMIADVLGDISYTGSMATGQGGRLNPKWVAENLIKVSLPIGYTETGPKNNPGSVRFNKHIAPHLVAAINESRATYGLPLSHIGTFVVKGRASGFSAHTFGAAIDLDSVVQPFTPEGKLSFWAMKKVLEGGNYANYWNFKNSQGQTYKQYLENSLQNKEKAISLYEFVAGPLNNNGIAQIFAKYGFYWGGSWKQNKKDTMHFEYIPNKAGGGAPALVAENKILNKLIKIIKEVEDNELAYK